MRSTLATCAALALVPLGACDCDPFGFWNDPTAPAREPRHHDVHDVDRAATPIACDAAVALATSVVCTVRVSPTRDGALVLFTGGLTDPLVARTLALDGTLGPEHTLHDVGEPILVVAAPEVGEHGVLFQPFDGTERDVAFVRVNDAGERVGDVAILDATGDAASFVAQWGLAWNPADEIFVAGWLRTVALDEVELRVVGGRALEPANVAVVGHGGFGGAAAYVPVAGGAIVSGAFADAAETAARAYRVRGDGSAPTELDVGAGTGLHQPHGTPDGLIDVFPGNEYALVEAFDASLTETSFAQIDWPSAIVTNGVTRSRRAADRVVVVRYADQTVDVADVSFAGAVLDLYRVGTPAEDITSAFSCSDVALTDAGVFVVHPSQDDTAPVLTRVCADADRT